MRLNIDFGNRYEARSTPDLRVIQFNTVLKDETFVPLKVEISDGAHELLPNVYNFAFGPMDEKGRIDDKAKLTHKDYSKTFSTILFAAITFLEAYPEYKLGIDGSTNGRAFLYYRAIQQNFDYLDKHFNIYGLKYYVRISRFGKTQYDDPFDFDDIGSATIKIEKGIKIPSDKMYNYFIFELKNN